MQRSALPLGVLIMGMTLLTAAEDADTTVHLPAVKVPATRLERYTVGQWNAPDGSFRLVFMPGPRTADMLAIFVGGVQPGDEIVRIDGKDVSTIKSHEWSKELYGNFKLVVKRPVGRRSYWLIEVDGRRAS